jgi:hypothetical protein
LQEASKQKKNHRGKIKLAYIAEGYKPIYFFLISQKYTKPKKKGKKSKEKDKPKKKGKRAKKRIKAKQNYTFYFTLDP